MSVILVVEQDAGYANRIANALRTTGHVVNVVPNLDAANQSSSLQPPQLVLASGSLPGAVELLERYSQRRGGPGAIVLLPVTLASQVQAGDFRADEVLAKPYSDQDLHTLTGKLLAASSPADASPTTGARPAAPRGQLTSADIFGDVLAEVEAEAQKSTPAAAPAKKPMFSQDDIDKKLEETLSGVLATGDRLVRPTPAPPAAPRAAAPPAGMPQTAAAPPPVPPRPAGAPAAMPPGAVPLPRPSAPATPAPIATAPTVAASAAPTLPGVGGPAGPPRPMAPTPSAPGIAPPQTAQPVAAPRPAAPPAVPPSAPAAPRPVAPAGLPPGLVPSATVAPPRRPQASAREIDDLLDKTLSSLELPMRAAKRPPGAPAPPGVAMPAALSPAPPSLAPPAAPRPAPVAPTSPFQAPAPAAAVPLPVAPQRPAAPVPAAPATSAERAPLPSDLMTVALPKAALAALMPEAWTPAEPTPPPEVPKPLAPTADLRGEPLEAWSPPALATPALDALPTPAPAASPADLWTAPSFEDTFELESALEPEPPATDSQAFLPPPIATQAMPSFTSEPAPAFVLEPVPTFGEPVSQLHDEGFEELPPPALETFSPASFEDFPPPVTAEQSLSGTSGVIPTAKDFSATDFSGAWSVSSYEEPAHDPAAPLAGIGVTEEPADFVSAFAPPPETGSFVRPLRLGDTGKISTADFGLGAETDQGLQATLDGVLQMRGQAGERIDSDLEGMPFGEYRLLERVALGGMAEVWRARRRGVEGFQKTVAIKKILSHLTGSADFITMFIDEAKLAAQLSHNNIIQIYDLGKVDDDFYIAMEYVEGKDLRTILTSSRDQHMPLPLPLALMIIAAVARALDYAHRKRDFSNRALGLVHRDVSPQNVLISYEGEIKLCDFGIVKAVAKASTTQMGALKGKLQYMSPEQAWGRDVDARSDIFSLGAVMFEVLTGTKLFTGDSEIGVLDAVRDCRLRSPRDIVPGLPEEVERIVRKALAKNPEDRYSTAGQMDKEITAALEAMRFAPSQHDLAEHMHHLFQTAPPAKPPALDISLPPRQVGPPAGMSGSHSAIRTQSRQLEPEKSKLPLIVAIVVGLLVIAALAFVLTREPEPAPGAGQAPAAAPAIPGAATPDPNDLRDLVNKGLTEQQKQIQDDYERQRRELQEKLDRVEGQQPPPQRQRGGGGSGGAGKNPGGN